MRFINALRQLEPESLRPDRCTWFVRRSMGTRVVKAYRVPDALRENSTKLSTEGIVSSRLPEAYGTPSWSKLKVVSPAQAAQIGLSEDLWVLGLRRFVEGQNLSELDPEPQQWRALLFRMAISLRQLHDVGVAHANLKPTNILQTPTDDIELLDVPVFTSNFETRHKVTGRAPYMAPEVWEGHPPSPKSDIYALGRLICGVICPEEPNSSNRSTQQWANFHRRGEWELPDELDKPERTFVARMLARNPSKRPSVEEVVGEFRDSVTCENTSSMVSLPEVVEKHARQIVEEVRAVKSLCLGLKTLPGTRMVSRLEDTIARRMELAGFVPVFVDGDRVINDSGACMMENAEGQVCTSICDIIEEVRHTGNLGAVIRKYLVDSTDGRLPFLIWRNFHEANPEIRRNATELLGSVTTWGTEVEPLQRRMSALLISDDVTELPDFSRVRQFIPERSDWENWRATTLRSAVRSVSDSRWERLLDKYRDNPDALERHLSHEIDEHQNPASQGRRRAPVPPEVQHSETVSSQDMADLESKLSAGQVDEVAKQCRKFEERMGEASVDRHIELLELWITALWKGGGRHKDIGTISRNMRAAGLVGDFAWPIIERILALCSSGHLYGEGLSTVSCLWEQANLTDASDIARRVRLLMWRAHFYVRLESMEKAYQDACDGLEAAEQLDAGGLQGERIYLKAVRNLCSALAEDRKTIRTMNRWAIRLGETDSRVLFQADVYRMQAQGLIETEARDEATDALEDAVHLLERAGKQIELANYLLEVASNYRVRCEFGLARARYVEAKDSVTSRTPPTVRARICLGFARVECVLGRFETARQHLERAGELVFERQLGKLEPLVWKLRGDLAYSERETEQALDYYREAFRTDLEIRPRQSAQLRLNMTDVALFLGDEKLARRSLDKARAVIAEHQFAQLKPLLNILRARMWWRSDRPMGRVKGVELFKRAMDSSIWSGQQVFTTAQMEPLWEELSEYGVEELKDDLIDKVHSACRTVAVGLPTELRKEYLEQFEKVSIPVNVGNLLSGAPESVGEDADRRSQRESDQLRSAGNQAKRNAEHLSRDLSGPGLEDVWADAIQRGLEMTGAERAFVVRKNKDDQAYTVVASGNQKGQSIEQPDTKINRDIVEKAADLGKPVVSVDADDREQPNTALPIDQVQLRSVACVPIWAGDKIAALMYLDHYYQAGFFQGETKTEIRSYGEQLGRRLVGK